MWRRFEIAARGSTPSVEVLAGVSTFLSLSYIFIVNPALLGGAGMPCDAVFFATVVASAIATFAMGAWANLPYVLAPGMEINVYVATVAIPMLHLTWQEALGAVFWSGVLFVLLTISGARERIIAAIPSGMTASLACAVATLLATVALRNAELLHYEGPLLASLGVLGPRAAVLAVSLIAVIVLRMLRLRAAVLLSIIAGAAAAYVIGVRDAASSIAGVSGPLSAIAAADLRVIVRPNGWMLVLVIFLIDFYGSVAKLVGLVRRTELARDGGVPRLREALLVDGAAAAGGSLLGTTSVLVYAESGVGIAAGGRTGLTAITAAIAMLLCLPGASLLAHVPTAATTGALLYVAWRLLPRPADLREMDAWELTAAAGMALITATSSQLHLAILFGLGVHLMHDFFRGVRLNAYAIGSVVLLLVGWWISV